MKLLKRKKKRKKDGMRVWLISWGALGALAAAAPALGVALGQVDDFQDGTLELWAGGSGSGSTLINIPNVGLYGTGDHCLQITASNSNLGTNNTVQWLGNYLAAQVTKIGFHLNNTGVNPLALRISVFGPGGTFTTTNEVVLPPASGWVAVDFSLDASALTQTAGGGTLNQTLANVNTVLIRHDPDPISMSGQPNPVTGQLRIDNVRALPVASGIVLGQLDDFQDETLEAWAGIASLTNIPNGGPDGAWDRYLQISASSSQPGTHNNVQWNGDYLAAQVAKINVHLNNTGVDPLALRMTVFGPGGNFTTTDETVLPPASGWVSVDFALDSSALTKTSGPVMGTLAETLANVRTLVIRHDPDPISPFGVGDPVTGTLGIDNIRALPEPGSTALLAAGVAALALARSARRRPRGAR